MEKTAKIIVWAIVAVVLSGVLIWALAGGASLDGNIAYIIKNIRVNDFVDSLPDDAQTGERFEKKADEIQNISMRFVDEHITIVSTDETVIRVEENSSQAIETEDVMHYGTKDGELVIQSGRTGRVFGWSDSYPIDVKIMLPRSFNGGIDIETVSGAIEIGETDAETLLVKTTSGDITIAGGAHQEIRMESVSGKIELKKAQAESLRADTMSGVIKLQGNYADVDVDSTSGSIWLEADDPRSVKTDTTSGATEIYCKQANRLETISIDSVSGDVSISLPEESGFELRFDTVSGTEENEFAMKGDTYSDGQAEIKVDTASGSLYVKQQNAS